MFWGHILGVPALYGSIVLCFVALLSQWSYVGEDG